MQETIPITAELERMKAQIDGLNEARKATTDKIIALSERIGEMRRALAEQERSIKDYHSSALRAIELVERTQPDALLKEIKREDAKIDALRAKLDSNELLLTKITDEIKELRRTISLFRGIEQLQKLSDEIKEDLKAIKKIEDNIKRHADRVEKIFVETQKKDVAGKFGRRIDGMERIFRDLVKDFDKIRVDASGSARKEDFEKLEREFRETMDTLEKFRILFAAKSKEFEELRMGEIAAISRENDRVVKELSKRIGTTERDLYSIKDAVRELKKETSGIMKEFRPFRTKVEHGILRLERNLDEFGKDIRDIRRRAKVKVKPKPKPKEKPKIPAEIEALHREREEIRALLASLEEYHRKGSLSDSTYRDLKATNEEKLRRIEEAIRTGK